MYPVIDKAATGKRIREIMEERDVTVKDIQNYLSLSCVQSIYHWLEGKTMPTIDNLYAMSEYLNVSIDEMICGNRKKHMVVEKRQSSNRWRLYFEKSQNGEAA